MSAFVPSFPFTTNRGSSARRCTFKVCRPAKALTKHWKPQAKLAGWTETRLAIQHLQIVNAPAQSPVLPGIHFEKPPTITGSDILSIVKGDTPDEWVNEIVRTLLGWRKLDDTTWNNDLVSPEWRQPYPDEPPNFIGKAGDYSPSTDRPVKIAIQRLTRSIPREYKQIFKEVLRPMGFSGWKIHELTPNRTRRATAVNWILYWYRVHYPDYEWC